MLAEIKYSHYNHDAITKSVLEVFAFFDLFNYPLTAREVWQLSSGLDIDQYAVGQRLEQLVSQGNLGQLQAFYFLPGRDELVATRHERYNITAEKFKYAMRAVKLFRWLPWIKLIAVGNLIGGHNLRRESDIDLLIVTTKGRIWISRLLVTTITKFLGWRPQLNNSQDKICLSFWASEDALDFSKLKLENDLYFRYWLAGLYPVYDSAGIYEKLVSSNAWLNKELPNWSPKQTVRGRQVGSIKGLLAEMMLNIFFGWSEGLAKKIQLMIMSPELKRLMNQDTRVVVNDQILKFHANDRREEYWQKFNEKIKSLGI